MRLVRLALFVAFAISAFCQGTYPPASGGGGAPSGSAGGDLSGSYPNPGVTKLNGTTVPTNSTANQVALTTASAVTAWTGIPACLDSAGQHLNFNTAAHTFSCGTSGSTSPGSPLSSVQGNCAGAFCGITGSLLDTNGIRKFTFSQLAAPSAPTAALLAVAGNLGDVDTVGAHRYCVVFTTGTPDPIYQSQMTECGTASNSVTTDAGHGQVTAAIPVGPSGVTSRIVYREDFASGTFSYLATVSNNTDTTYTDNRSDDVLGCSDDTCTAPYPDAPVRNSTGGQIYAGGNALGNWTPEGLRIGQLYFQSSGLGLVNSLGALNDVLTAPGTNNLFMFGGNSTLTGQRNLGLGLQSLNGVTTGSANVAVGVQSLKALTTAINSAAFGDTALLNVTTGHGNTGFGQGACQSVTTGTYNTCVGQFSGVDQNAAGGVTTGSNNFFGGEDAHTNKTDLMNAVCIGPNCDVEQDGQVVFGNAVDTTETLLYGRVRMVPHTPASSSETCTAGTIALDTAGGFIDICTSTNTWKRVALSSF